MSNDEVTVTMWGPANAVLVPALVRKHRGKYLQENNDKKVPQGKGFGTSSMTIIEFPSAAAANAFVHDPDYALSDAKRTGRGDSELMEIDDAGLADTTT